MTSADETASTDATTSSGASPSIASDSLPRGTGFADLLTLVRRLRAPDGCPWDRAQTPRSLLPYFIEECYELREAVLEGSEADLAEELGDLALHLAFQIVVAEEHGRFDPDTVFARVLGKMVRRHPHVFGAEAAPTIIMSEPEDPDRASTRDAPHEEPRPPFGSHVAGDAPAAPRFNTDRPQGGVRHWEELKRRERAAASPFASLLNGLPRALPALLKAQRMQERAAAVGFDWPDHRGPLHKVDEELDEVERHLVEPPAEVGRTRLEEELGDLLFAVVNLCRKLDIAAEDALDLASAKFRRRFATLEALGRERGLDLGEAGLERLDELWEEVKEAEKAAPGTSAEASGEAKSWPEN